MEYIIDILFTDEYIIQLFVAELLFCVLLKKRRLFILKTALCFTVLAVGFFFLKKLPDRYVDNEYINYFFESWKFMVTFFVMALVSRQAHVLLHPSN